MPQLAGRGVRLRESAVAHHVAFSGYDPIVDVRTRLRSVFVQALGLAPDIDVDNLRYRAVAEWDSVGHMALVGAIEDAFDVRLDTEQVIGMDSFDAAVTTVRACAADE